MQIVYISNRPEILCDTLFAVRQHMTFVDDVVVIVPGKDRTRFDASKLPSEVVFINDETLVEENLTNCDHQARNYRLRMALSEHSSIADEFIMSDDDARPLTRVESTFFKHNDKYNSYFFYDLKDWIYGENDFDVGQRNTYQVLKYLNFPHLAFACHMPQIINKLMLVESKQCVTEFSQHLSLCEWSIYFNIAIQNFPHRFYPPTIYKTLCWPDCVTCWPKMFDPDEYVFENYSPHLYSGDGPFAGIEVPESERMDIRFEKILQWSRHEIKLMQGKGMDNSMSRWKYANWLVRPLKRLKDIILLQERVQILRMARELREIKRSEGSPATRAKESTDI